MLLLLLSSSSIVPSEECRYQSVCQQLSILSQQNSDETIKKSSSNKLTTDDVQVGHNHSMEMTNGREEGGREKKHEIMSI